MTKSQVETATSEVGVVTAADIPDQRQDERFFSQLLDSVQESVVATDLDGRITYWGRGAEALYGYRKEEVLGRCVTIIVESSQQEAERERWRQVFETGSWRGEYEQLHKDGTKFWASTVISLVKNETGQPIGFVGIDADVTDQKRVTEEIEQLKLAIENAMQGISRLDCNGRFIMVKPQYAELLGYGPDELIGESWEVTVPPDDQDAARAGYEAMLRDGRASLECRARKKDGSVFYKQLLLVKTHNDCGEHDGHYCFMSDVTKRREAEDKLRLKEAELAHVSRLSTMGELVAGIAHEINQPLYAIANFAVDAQKQLADGNPNNADLKEIHRHISDQAIRAGDIIRRLRDFVQKTDGVYSSVDLNAVVQDAFEILTPIARRCGASVHLNLCGCPLLVPADRVQLEQVIVNLLRNAIEAVTDRERRVILIYTERTEECVRFAIEDTGDTVGDSVVDKMFDAFFTTKPSGMGMGLAISRTIVESHGGVIQGAAKPDGGLRVTIELPLSRVDE
ncbi:MAG: PAS domain S-box protein [Planctomycetota bacterium]